MKVVRKHTEGPFVWAGVHIFQKDDVHEIARVNERRGVSEAHNNVLLFTQAPAMLDYLIERAEEIEEDIGSYDGPDFSGRREELSRLIKIIKAAGVDIPFKDGI